MDLKSPTSRGREAWYKGRDGVDQCPLFCGLEPHLWADPRQGCRLTPAGYIDSNIKWCGIAPIGCKRTPIVNGVEYHPIGCKHTPIIWGVINTPIDQGAYKHPRVRNVIHP